MTKQEKSVIKALDIKWNALTRKERRAILRRIRKREANEAEKVLSNVMCQIDDHFGIDKDAKTKTGTAIKAVARDGKNSAQDLLSRIDSAVAEWIDPQDIDLEDEVPADGSEVEMEDAVLTSHPA